MFSSSSYQLGSGGGGWGALFMHTMTEKKRIGIFTAHTGADFVDFCFRCPFSFEILEFRLQSKSLFENGSYRTSNV